jgi:hypothetical protein
LVRDLDSLARAGFYAPAAAPAATGIDHRLITNHGYGLREAYIIQADFAAGTELIHPYFYARHPADLSADRRIKVGQHFPQTAAGAAVTDGNQIMTRPSAQPYRVQLVPADHVHQTCFPASVNMIICFFP